MQGLKKAAFYGGLAAAAAAAGAILGVLFAPSSGQETRRKLGLWLKERRQKGAVEYQAAREALAAGRKAFQEKHQTPAGV